MDVDFMEIDRSIVKELYYINADMPRKMRNYLAMMEELPDIRNCELTKNRKGELIIKAEYTGRGKIGEAGRKTKRTINKKIQKNVSKMFSEMPQIEGFSIREAHPDLYDQKCYGSLVIDSVYGDVHVLIHLRKVDK